MAHGMKTVFAQQATQFERIGDWKISNGHCVMRAHEWKGHVWEHEIKMYFPAKPLIEDTCYLEITGENAGERDDMYGQALAEALRMPVAVLFQIPNQPLYGMVEDDLVAHTFEQYIQTQDPEWPLLVPMVRSAICAMDTVSGWQKGRIKRYVVGGASKRAWTSWLLAQVGDSRVAGIVPVVFDNLDIRRQLERQVALWEQHSPKLDDYTRRKLHELAGHPEGQKLIEMVDPYYGLSSQKVPALVVTGSRDPFWSVDAARHYYRQLPVGSGLLVVPNMGHTTSEWEFRMSTVAAFCRACAGWGTFPQVQFEIMDEDEGVIFQSRTEDDPEAVRVWGALSDSFWFAESEFFVDKLDQPCVRIRRRPDHNQALFMEMEFRGEAGPVRLTSPCAIVPRSA